MKTTTIKDIYAGKPDAKDEINTSGLDDFVKSFVVPYNFDVERLVNDHYYFITGYKGTGKTALLFYLDNYVKEVDKATCSSFVFFKEEFSDNKKQELENLSKRILSTISIGNNVLLEGNDYEYIWRWLLLKQIVDDNEDYNDGLFINNEDWSAFKRQIERIHGKFEKKKLTFPSKVKLAMPLTDPSTMITVAPEVELNFQSNNSPEALKNFIEIIDTAEELFKHVSRTDIPYYIFIDELEAYYGDESVFFRDLRLIRDLIFTVKRINSILTSFDVSTKIFCSVRTEIINAITRFIVTKELNKVTSGFEMPLVWDYNNTNSFAHPIVKILLKRIDIAETNNGYPSIDDKDLYFKWFPEQINNQEPANYILNNGWSKPRDIVRLITVAQHSIHSNSKVFSKAVFDSCQKRYSIDSLVEIKEEMKALYSPEQIDNIISCLTGFRTVFTTDELHARINRYFQNTILIENLNQILRDLYRLGVLGNYSVASKLYRWQHRRDDDLIISDEWSIIVHPALYGALSISGRHDHGIRQLLLSTPRINEIYTVEVKKIVEGFLLVDFFCGNMVQKGSIHISQLSNEYVPDIFMFTQEGARLSAKIIDYDSEHNKWRLTLKI